MFSRRNSTLMPVSRMYDRPLNTQFSQSQSQQNYSQGSMLGNSEEMYSQSQPYPDRQEFWSSQNSMSQHPVSSQYMMSSQQNNRAYKQSGSLFNKNSSRRTAATERNVTREHNVTTERNVTRTSASVDKFRNVVFEKNDINGRQVMENFANVLRDCTDSVKEYLEEMKGSLSNSSELKSRMDDVISKVTSSEELIQKLEESITSSLSKELKAAKSSEDLKAELSSKDVEIATKGEKIEHLKTKIDELKKSIDEARTKENGFQKDQGEKMDKVLTTCSTSANSLESISNSQQETSAMLQQLLKENKQIFQQMSVLSSWQKAHSSSHSDMKSTITSLSSSVARTLKQDNMRGESALARQAQPPSPSFASPAISEPSPFPRGTRWFDANGNPSPAAVVKPVVIKPFQGPTPQSSSVSVQRVVPTFDETDSDSGDDFSALVDNLDARKPSSHKKNLMHHTSSGVQSANTNNSFCHPGRLAKRYNIKSTPRMQGTSAGTSNSVRFAGTSSVPGTTPVSRKSNTTQMKQGEKNAQPSSSSIRNYGRIKKFTPVSPVTSCKGATLKVREEDCGKHINKKKLLTIDDHWEMARSCK